MRRTAPIAAGLALTLAVGLAVAAAGQARVVEATALRAAPDHGSRRLAELEPDTTVEREERRGGWVAVRPPGGQRGWVRLWTVRDVESGEGLLGALKRFGRKVTGYFRGDSDEGEATSGVTATIGVRGLGGHGGRADYERPALAVTVVDTSVLRAIRRHAVGPRTARAFATEAGLRARPAIRTPGAGVSEAEDWSGW